MNPLKKCISMGGPTLGFLDYDPNTNQPAYSRLHANDYRLLLWNGNSGVYYRHNRNYIVASGTKWVKLWISWFELQNWMSDPNPDGAVHNFPSSQYDSWDKLNGFDNGQSGGRPPYTGSAAGRYPYMQRLDRQIKAINDDGFNVILTVYPSYPYFWTTGTYNQKLADPKRGTHAVNQKVDPNAVQPQSYWGWFIAHLIARYTRGVPINNPGPNANNAVGNTTGASIQALEFINEPNFTQWPQDTIASTASNMMQTAHDLAGFFGWQNTGQWILGPGTLDFDGASDTNKTNYDRFTIDVLNNLQQFRPYVYCGWSQHNYNDVLADNTTRINTSVGRLGSQNWRGGGDRWVWLTEGGYKRTSNSSTEQANQSNLVTNNFNRMTPNGSCPMWTNHIILNRTDDPNDSFLSGVRGAHYNFLTGVPFPSPERTFIIDYEVSFYTTWKNLPGSPTP